MANQNTAIAALIRVLKQSKNPILSITTSVENPNTIWFDDNGFTVTQEHTLVSESGDCLPDYSPSFPVDRQRFIELLALADDEPLFIKQEIGAQRLTVSQRTWSSAIKREPKTYDNSATNTLPITVLRGPKLPPVPKSKGASDNYAQDRAKQIGLKFLELAAGTSDIRPVYRQIHGSNGLWVSADGYRLHKLEGVNYESVGYAATHGGYFLPTAHAIAEFERFKGKTGSLQDSPIEVDLKYPDWKAMENNLSKVARVNMNTAQFSKQLKPILKFIKRAKIEGCPITVTYDAQTGQLMLKAVSLEHGEMVGYVPATSDDGQYTPTTFSQNALASVFGNGQGALERVSVRINAEYLSDAIHYAGDTVALTLYKDARDYATVGVVSSPEFGYETVKFTAYIMGQSSLSGVTLDTLPYTVIEETGEETTRGHFSPPTPSPYHVMYNQRFIQHGRETQVAQMGNSKGESTLSSTCYYDTVLGRLVVQQITVRKSYWSKEPLHGHYAASLVCEHDDPIVAFYMEHRNF